MTPEQSRLVKIALGIVTDMSSIGDDDALEFEGSELERVVTHDVTSEAEIVTGLMNLVQILLVKLEAHGESIPDVLADIGRRY